MSARPAVSYLLYSHRLWWDGRTGVCALRGCYRKVASAPAVFADAEYIDYAPEVGVFQIRRRGEPMRDMRDDEKATAEAHLRELFPGPAAAHPTPPRMPPNATVA